MRLKPIWALQSILKDREFVGRSAIVAAKKNSELPVRIGLMLEGKRPAREHCDILVGGNKVGVVTSGTFSPTLERSIAMAYICACPCGGRD
jgi:aminomethyltransferase